MRDLDKSKEQLLYELLMLRKRVDELRAAETEHAKADEALLDSERRYRMLAESAEDSIFIVGRDLVVRYMNSFASRQFGKNPEELIDKPLNLLFPPETFERQKNNIMEVFKSGELASIESNVVFPTGEVWLDTQLIPLKDDQGTVTSVMGVSRDATKRKRAEGRLSKINEVFLNFGTDPLENINRLTELCGKLLNADCALYNKLKGEILTSCGIWNAPPDYKTEDRAEGHICYDVIGGRGDDVLHVRNLQDSKYAKTDPNVAKYGLKTYLGRAVKFGGANVGSLCVVFIRDFVPTENDKGVMSIIASAIGVEEARLEAEYVNQLAQFSIEKAGDAIFWVGSDARILYVNDKSVNYLGYSREDLLSMTVHDIDPDFTKEVWPDHWRELRERGSFAFETFHRKKDGTLIPVEITVNYLNFHGEEYNFAFARDITERKMAEEALREETGKANSYLNVAGVIIVAINEDQAVSLINKKGCEILGWSEDEIVGKNWFDSFLPESIRESTRELFIKSIRDEFKGMEYYENPVLTKSGEERIIAWHNAVLRDEGGRPVAALSSGEDITDRKIAEQALARRDDQLEILSRTSIHINAILEIPQILRTIVAAAMEVLGATAGAAGLVKGGKIIIKEYDNNGKTEAVDYAFEPGYGVPGWVLKTMKPYVSNSAEHDPHVAPEIQKALGFYNLVSVPIINRKGTLLGCVEIHNKEGHKPFDTQDVFMLQGVAASAAVALDNANVIIEQKGAENELARRVKFERLITRVSTNFISIAPEEIDAGLNKALKEIGEFVGADRSYIFLMSAGGAKMSNTHEWCAKGVKSYIKSLKDLSMSYFPWLENIIKRHETVYVPSVKDMPPEAKNEKAEFESEDIKSLIVVPMVYGQSLVGFLGFDSVKSEKKWTEENVALLKIVGEIFVNAFERKWTSDELGMLNEELIESNKRLKQLALKDTHTGLYNHHYLSEVIDAEFYRAKREVSPLSVIMLDIDYFKSINELYGHQFGDLVLKQFAKQLQRLVRRYDVVVRFGGEEFVVMTPGTDRAKAMTLAQRVLDAMGLYSFGNKEHTVKLKLSMAIASYPEDRVFKGIDLITTAEHVLIKAKEYGGNRVYTSMDVKLERKGLAGKARDEGSTKLLQQRIETLTKKGNQSLIEAIHAFAKTIELKDHYTGEHVESTVRYATEIAKALNLNQEEVDRIKKASALHDLGKVGISDKILLKKSKLTKKEFEEIKKHPQIAADIIRPIQFLHDIIPLIFYHHERWDGKGYPNGLKGEEIPIGARVIAISDVYQALTSDRPYRKAYSTEVAIRIIKKGASTQFDPKVVDTFIRLIEANVRKGRKSRKRVKA